jgi:hypothetical protein
LKWKHYSLNNLALPSLDRFGYSSPVSLLDQFFVYHPEPWKDQDWRARSGLPLEDIWFTAADGTKLFGWYVENAETSAVLLWCHGNAGNIIKWRQ